MQIATLLAAFALVATNIDTIVNFWNKYFGNSDEIEALVSPTNRQVAEIPNPSGIVLDLVQSPREQDKDKQTYDLYLENTRKTDVLLAGVAYKPGYQPLAAWSGNSSHQLAPNANYTINVTASGVGDQALAPPYLLKAGSKAAIRITFNKVHHQDRFKSSIGFQILDSRGTAVATVDVLD